jgi:YVTN family beta-propeller protein
MTKWFAVLLCSLAGCASTPGPLTPEDLAPVARGVYVLNEGVWGQSNGSLSLFDPQSGTVHQNVFSAANGRALGDVANYILVQGQEAYIILNGSDRIEVIETQRQSSRGTINLTPGLSPRQMAVINDTVGLVTNLYDASVSVINLRRLAELSRIPVGPNPEGIAIAAGTAFVANSGLGTGRSVSMIDLATLSPVGALEVADNPAEILTLDGSRVVVLCAGSYGDFANPDDDTPATLITIDAFQRVVVDSLRIGGHAFRMASDGANNLYIPGSASVLRIDATLSGSVETFVQGEYYGVGVDTLNGDVYLGDARTFSIPGEVRVFTSSGTEKGRFDAGLIPGRFAFLRQ